MLVKERAALATCLGVALAVRLAVLAIHGSSPIDMDGAEYARLGEHLAGGAGYVGMRGVPTLIFPPLYPALIALLTLVLHDAERAGLAVSVLCGTAWAGVLYALAATVYDARTARVAALLGAVLPMEVQLSTSVLADATFALTATAGILFLVRLLRSWSVRDAALCAGCLGLAYLARPEGVLLLGVAFALAAVTARAGHRHGSPVAVVATVACAVVAANVAFGYTVGGRAVLESKSSINFALAQGLREGKPYIAVADAVDPQGSPLGPEIAPAYFDARLRPATPPPATRVALAAAAMLHHVRDVADALTAREYGAGVPLVLALVGLFRCPWSRERRRDELVLLACAAVLFLALASVGHFWARYAAAFVPFVLLWAARGVHDLGEWSRRSRLPNVGLAALGAALIVSLATDVAAAVQRDVPLERPAGAWLAAHGGRTAFVVDDDDRIAFYGGAAWGPLPYAGERAAIRYLSALAPEYLVLDSRRAADYPLLARWFAQGPPRALTSLAYRTGDGDRRTIRVYRWGTNTARAARR